MFGRYLEFLNLLKAGAEEVQNREDVSKEAYKLAFSQGPKWRERITSSLSRMPEAKSLLDVLRWKIADRLTTASKLPRLAIY